jgi:diguanylate cyclase (GGDEF)-like protein
MVAFLIYSVYELVVSLLNINKKAYIDSKTKLFNKAYWEDLVRDVFSAEEQTAMIMFDLNGLKHTNDTLGHNAGDKMIFEFSSILKKEIGSKELLCRWGGDEFAAFVRNADREKTDEYISAVNSAVAAYNSSGQIPEIHFACGCALSCDFPNLSWSELLSKADEYMYKNKKSWYSENLTDVR